MSSGKQPVSSLTADVFIAGGGPVGLMLALGLAQINKKTVLAEPCPFVDSIRDETSKNSFDSRVLALSKGSQVFLRNIGLWQALKPYCTAIEHIHVSQKGYLGLTTLHANEVDVDALGYSVQSSDLGRVLWQAVEQSSEITTLTPAQLNNFKQDQQGVAIEVSSANDKQEIIARIQAQLIVGADGTQSTVRQLLQLPIEEHLYEAFGVLALIETEKHPQGWAYERFTEEGPVALLPLRNHFHKAVLVCPKEKVEQIKNLSDKEYLDFFAEKMGERLGRFTQVSERVIYPLKEIYTPQRSSVRALLMGNASHTQHPVAAQGLNLGIRDIDVFLQMSQHYEDLGSARLLSEYLQQREPDHKKVMGLTDTLIQVFQHKSPMLGHLRGLGMIAMQNMPSLKKRFSKFAMNGQRRST